MIKGGFTLGLSFPKAWFFGGFAVQIPVASSIALFRSLSFGLQHRKVIGECFQNNECSGGTKIFVGISRQKKAFETALHDDL